MDKLPLNLGEPEDYLFWLRRATEDVRRAQAEQTRTAIACRDLGLSWQEIGKAMGVSKQAVQQRFGS